MHSRVSIFLLTGLLTGLTKATPGHAARADDLEIFGARPGYTSDIEYEKNTRSHEMVMLPKDTNPEKPLAQVIFNENLTREFQKQYEFKFGVTQAEQVINSPGRYDEYTFNTGKNATVKQYRSAQRRFGEYMMRRLIEFHVDNYAKRDPGLRAVYEFKDKVSNLEVKTKQGWNVKWKYNISGPTMDFQVKNPYDIEMRARVEMTGLISKPTEVIYQLGYQLTPRIRISEYIKQVDGIFQSIIARRMTPHIVVSASASFDTNPAGANIQQNIFLLGFGWSE